MRIAILADIHECSDRLRRMLDRLVDERVDRYIAIGDVGDLCIELDETVALLESVNALAIWGNHDFELCNDPPAELAAKMTPRVRAYLARMTDRVVLNDNLFTHVEPRLDTKTSEGLWWHGGRPKKMEDVLSDFAAAPQRRQFFGHLHRWFAANEREILDWDGTQPLELDAGQRYLISVHTLSMGYAAVIDDQLDTLYPFWVPRN